MRFSEHSPDSTFIQESLQRPSHQFAPSLFTQHILRQENRQPDIRQKQPADWIILLLIGFLIILAWLRVFYFKRLRQIFRAPWSKRNLSILIKEGNLLKERISLALASLYLFTYSFLLYLAIIYFLPRLADDFRDYILFLACLAALSAFWTLKMLAIRFLGIVFHTESHTHEYIQNILAFSFLTGLALYPMTILILFFQSDLLFYFTLGIAMFLFGFRLLRGFFIGLSLKKFSYLFLFVYLCTLEILPLLIILKGLQLFSKGF